MSHKLSFEESIKVIGSSISNGLSFVELITIQTGITLSHLALIGDELLQKLRSTTYELMKVKSLTGNTKQPIERSLSKSLVLFLYHLDKQGGDCHYNDIRTIVKDRYDLTVNDYSTLKYYRLIEKSKTGNGYWKMNERGQRFLEDKLKLSERLTIQNNKVIGASKQLVNVTDFINLNDNSVNDFLIEKRKDGMSRWK